MRRVLGVLLAAAAVLGGSACRTEAPNPGEARAHVAPGAVATVRAAGASAFVPLRDGATVVAGSAVRGTRGEVVLELARRVRLTLAPTAEVVVDTQPEVRRGEVLVQTAASPATVAGAGSHFVVAASSTARVHRTFDTGVGVYGGAARIVSADRTLSVPAFRSAAVPAFGLLPDRPRPLALDAHDAWDVRFLGLAFDLTSELDAGSAGFTVEAPTATPDDVVALVGGSASATDLLRGRRPGDQLVGAAIAGADHGAGAGSFADRLRRVTSFRDDGAAWGLVALDATGHDSARAAALVRRAISTWVSRAGGLGAPVPGAVAVAPVAASGAPAAPAPDAPPVATPAPSAPTATEPTPATTPTTAPPVAVTVPTVPSVTVPTLPPVTVPSPVGDVLDVIGGATGAVTSGLGAGAG